MSDVKWIKIVTDIFDDEKILLIETLPEADSIIVIWFKLLCLAGKQNNSGVFTLNGKIPYTDKMFSTIFRRKESIIQLALQTFINFGMIEIIENTIVIPNWGKHQTLDKIESRNEYMRNYMVQYRSKQISKVNSKVNSILNVNSAELDSKEVDNKEEDNKEIEKDIDTYLKIERKQLDFDLFWKAYPRKAGKSNAIKAWKKVKVDIDVILNAIEKAKTSAQWQDQNGRFIPYPASWLNSGGWDDEIMEVKEKEDWRNF